MELGFELDELLKADIALDVEITGFGSIEIDGLIQPTADSTEDGFEGLEPLQPGPAVSRLSDKWLLGEHVILNHRPPLSKISPPSWTVNSPKWC